MSATAERPAMHATLLLCDYYAMECATVDCPACGARRGEKCLGKNVVRYQASGHTDRKNAFRSWAKRNPDAYKRLRRQAQLLAESRTNPRTNELYMGEN